MVYSTFVLDRVLERPLTRSRAVSSSSGWPLTRSNSHRTFGGCPVTQRSPTNPQWIHSTLFGFPLLPSLKNMGLNVESVRQSPLSPYTLYIPLKTTGLKLASISIWNSFCSHLNLILTRASECFSQSLPVNFFTGHFICSLLLQPVELVNLIVILVYQLWFNFIIN